MQKYTELSLRELKAQLNKEREDEEGRLAASMNKRGLTHSGAHISSVLDAGYNFIDQLLEGIFETEKKALAHNQSLLPEDYFDILKKELVGILEQEMGTVQARVLERFVKGDDRIKKGIVSQIDQKKGAFQDSIKNRAEMLQEEMRLGMLKPSPSTAIHIEGDVGAINTGVVYGSVQGEINKIRESADSKIADLFDKLLDTINTSEIADTTKKEQMQNVELLTQQYSQPKDERNYGLVNASLTFLSAATNLSNLWAQYGQAFLDIFK